MRTLFSSSCFDWFGRCKVPLVSSLWLVIVSLPAIPVSEIILTIDDLNSPAASLKGISTRFTPGGSAQVTVAEAKIFGRLFRKISITCGLLEVSARRVRCNRGKLQAPGMISELQFNYVPAAQRLELIMTPSATERWRIAGDFGATRWQAALEVSGGQLMRFASFIPQGQPLPSKGAVNGVLKISGTGGQIGAVESNFRWSDLVFSDQAGLHAGDKLAGTLLLTADRAGDALRWRAELSWDSGEVFWAPLYFPSGGHRLEARGTLTGESVRLVDGILKLKDVGQSRLSLDWDLNGGLSTLTADASGLDAGGLYILLLKPLLEKAALDQLTVSGRVNVAIRYGSKAIQQFDLTLGDLNITDAKNRFSIDRLSATIPWHAERETQATIRVADAKLLGIPIGAFEVPIKMRGLDFDVEEVAVPVLDGKLLVKDFQATRDKENWRWQFSGVLLPVSMEALTKALDLPLMRGILSATIPKVAYDEGRVGIEGGIGIRLFDGDVAVTQMSLVEPFGRAPRLNADVEMRNLDLGLLTSTFKFGSIEGRIDADIKGLELSNWKPVAFDARIESSPGNYRKKISQQAVQNISALGGAGAAAAIQRSFLRFFEEFGYQKIGLSCRLRNGVCEMSGIESTPDGYIIVKGGGIPAITVKGYNRHVGWDELLERLSRIMQGNVQPVIK